MNKNREMRNNVKKTTAYLFTNNVGERTEKGNQLDRKHINCSCN